MTTYGETCREKYREFCTSARAVGVQFTHLLWYKTIEQAVDAAIFPDRIGPAKVFTFKYSTELNQEVRDLILIPFADLGKYTADQRMPAEIRTYGIRERVEGIKRELKETFDVLTGNPFPWAHIYRKEIERQLPPTTLDRDVDEILKKNRPIFLTEVAKDGYRHENVERLYIIIVRGAADIDDDLKYGPFGQKRFPDLWEKMAAVRRSFVLGENLHSDFDRYMARVGLVTFGHYVVERVELEDSIKNVPNDTVPSNNITPKQP